MTTDPINHALHHGWPQVEAEVLNCRFVRATRDCRVDIGEAAYYAVNFAYQVNGITYQGDLTSPVEVQPHDKFSIRYNPEHPEENNSIFSGCERGWFKDYTYLTYLFAALIFGLVVCDLVRNLLHR